MVRKGLVTAIIICSQAFAQRVDGELIFQNIPTGSTLYMQAQGTAWCGRDNDWRILTDSDLLNHTLTGKGTYYLEFYKDAGYDHDGVYGHGKYKITLGSYYCYIDWRDGDYDDGSGSYGTNYVRADLHVKWSNNVFQHWTADETWEQIPNGGYIGIWDGNRKTTNTQNLNRFQPTKPQNLVKETPYYHHPQFSWDEPAAPAQDDVPDGILSFTYNVWGRIFPGMPVKIASNLWIRSYIDSEVLLHPSGQRYEYRITANSGDGQIESPFSNIITYFASMGKEIFNNPIPVYFELWPNHPDPFNPVTSIQLGLPEDSKIELVVFDLAGRVVRNLVSGKMEAGYQRVDWDGTDDQGLQVSSGVYIYLLTAVSLESEKLFTKSGKMVLLK